ncbi:hypothetical protein PI124_g1802 [Phytophthora idaei]|nr:hypothetical protein PI124_g1802 [Phytophthora idaei]
MPVLVLTALEQTARQTEGFVKGVVSRCVGSMIGTDSILYRATETGKDVGWLKKGDAVVAVHGIQEAKSASTNLLKVLFVELLRECDPKLLAKGSCRFHKWMAKRR